jgi:hypothetical protein
MQQGSYPPMQQGGAGYPGQPMYPGQTTQQVTPHAHRVGQRQIRSYPFAPFLFPPGRLQQVIVTHSNTSFFPTDNAKEIIPIMCVLAASWPTRPSLPSADQAHVDIGLLPPPLSFWFCGCVLLGDAMQAYGLGNLLGYPGRGRGCVRFF